MINKLPEKFIDSRLSEITERIYVITKKKIFQLRYNNKFKF